MYIDQEYLTHILPFLFKAETNLIMTLFSRGGSLLINPVTCASCKFRIFQSLIRYLHSSLGYILRQQFTNKSN